MLTNSSWYLYFSLRMINLCFYSTKSLYKILSKGTFAIGIKRLSLIFLLFLLLDLEKSISLQSYIDVFGRIIFINFVLNACLCIRIVSLVCIIEYSINVFVDQWIFRQNRGHGEEVIVANQSIWIYIECYKTQEIYLVQI